MTALSVDSTTARGGPRTKPAAAVVLQKARAWHEKPWGVKLLVPPAFLLLGVSRAALLTLPFRRIAPLLGHDLRTAAAVPLTDARQTARARVVGNAVATAARYTPWESRCLAQAMTARALLGAGKVPCGLYLGVRRPDGSGSPAHAWVCSGPVAVTGGRSFGRFTVVATFLSQAPDQPPADEDRPGPPIRRGGRATPDEALHDLLLDLLSTERGPDARQVGSLGDDGWDALCTMSAQNRVSPLLSWRLAHEWAGLPVPAAVRQRLATDHQFSTVRALALRRELILVTRALATAGIPSVALKGAYLAFFVYPDPALRPLRDLDLLVREEDAVAAYRVLEECGYRGSQDVRGDLAACASHEKHLPPLRGPAGISVELHVRLGSPGSVADMRGAESGIWQRAVERDVVGQRVSFPSPADLLLHTILHALYVHRLDNGPLALVDVALIALREPVDWPLFWRLAAGGGWTRGCRLVLAMAERYFGPLPAAATAPAGAGWAAAAAFAERVSTLTLRDVEARSDVKVAAALEGRSAVRKAAYLLGRAFPPKTAIATRYPVAADSPAVYLWYAPHLVWILGRRLPEFVANRHSLAVEDEAYRLAELDRWLVGVEA